MRSLLFSVFVLSSLYFLCNSQSANSNEETRSEDELTLHDMMVQCFEANKLERTTPRDYSTIVYVDDPDQPVITVDRWIDEVDAVNILEITNCVKQFAPEKYEYRPFDNHGYGGGNNVTYLNEIVQSLYPELLDQILDVAGSITDQVGWRPHPFHLGVRCIELLEYGPGGELRWHDDEDSIYTVSIMLTDPSSFTGGAFMIDKTGILVENQTVKRENILRINPHQYGGLLFDSLAPHGIAPLTSGFRTVLVIELWPFEDSSFDDFRPSLQRFRHRSKIPYLLRVSPANEELLARNANEVVQEEILQ